MTGKAGAPLTEAMFYVLMALRRGELCGTEIAAWTERCTDYRLTEKGQRAYRNERLRLRLCLADAEREDAGERL